MLARTTPAWEADRARLLSLGLAVLAFAALSSVAFIMNGVIAQRDRLESRNDMERTLSLLLAGLRDHSDFGSAIESLPSLLEAVVGVGAYDAEGARLYAWGQVPETVAPSPGGERPAVPGDPPYEADRRIVEMASRGTMALVLSPFRVGPPPPAERDPRRLPERPEGREADRRDAKIDLRLDEGSGFFYTTLRKAETVYLELRQDAFWRNRRLAGVLFPLAELGLAALVLFVRSLILRNAEYRRRIETQRNLVVLGTAASTLAHEIKNPLLSIRLQTRLLERTCPEAARRELGIIDDEVERLSALSRRVNDYLRDPAGEPRAVPLREAALDVSRRLLGARGEVTGDEALAWMDPERLRSVLENLARNAIESYPDDASRGDSSLSDERPVVIDVSRVGASVRVEVLDRGEGIDPALGARVFDPFFTTKSRGTGIGLAVCRRFVEAIGGSLALEPRQGGGSVARLVLPAAPEASCGS